MKIFLVLSFILSLPVIYYVGWAVWIKKCGITLTPTTPHKTIEVDYFILSDPQSSGEKLGESSFTIGDSGCLVACLATGINHLDHNFTISHLNKLFAEKGVYTGSGDVIWFKIKNAAPQVDYYYRRVFSVADIERDLGQNHLPIVKVRNFRSGRFHWLVIVGANQDSFVVMDSLNEEKKLVPLNIYGKVYAYRKLVKQD